MDQIHPSGARAWISSFSSRPDGENVTVVEILPSSLGQFWGGAVLAIGSVSCFFGKTNMSSGNILMGLEDDELLLLKMVPFQISGDVLKFLGRVNVHGECVSSSLKQKHVSRTKKDGRKRSDS